MMRQSKIEYGQMLGVIDDGSTDQLTSGVQSTAILARSRLPPLALAFQEKALGTSTMDYDVRHGK